MLKDLIENGYGKDRKLNCAEKILYGANEVYNLNLDKESLKLSAGFGGGMGVESTCGALTAAIMVLSKLAVEDTAHKSKVRDYTKTLLTQYENEMGAIDCKTLKKKHKKLFSGCDKIIIKAAEHLDETIKDIK
ncbi:C-GCAxxG-C-C family (seleno)protein [Thermohalobacter berrensis]|uniref:C_GCAxxG_C_C family protein n=1 Tax=Thermohalobacter berrensis TaxID=99594 RepID=A0A419T7W4_9FIRM|nr:C-GCAxxG-C-C family (seleno)protein [Thermohalobacter berrensis]RKD33456.1 hypothetical protein BET03_09400 [Thermohalobacter berrensis]